MRQEINVGVDVGGTSIKFGIIDESGRILQRHSESTQARRGSSAIVTSVIRGIDSLLSASRHSAGPVKSIGIGIPGTTDSQNGTVIFAPNLFWRDVEIAPFIRHTFNLPVYVAQDTRAAAWAEFLVGAGRDLRSVASVTLGTGIGCGMVFDGKIFHGPLNTAGEFGHQVVELDGAPCNCGRHGCLEAYAGGLAIVRRAKEGIAEINELLNKTPPDIAVKDVYQLAQAGNAKALEVTRSVVRYIGIGLVNLIALTSVEVIAISGGISNAPDELLVTPLTSFVREHAYESAASQVRIIRSLLGDDAPLIGAALLYRESVT